MIEMPGSMPGGDVVFERATSDSPWQVAKMPVELRDYDRKQLSRLPFGKLVLEALASRAQ